MGCRVIPNDWHLCAAGVQLSVHSKITLSSESFFLPGEVRHLHHDHAHLFGQHDDVVAVVVPLGHFGVELALLLSEALHLLGNLGLFLLGKLSHDGLRATGEETEALEQEEKLVRE